MAKLKSEDQNFETWFCISPGKTLDIAVTSSFTKETQEQQWQLTDLEFKSGGRSLNFISDPDQTVESFTAAVKDIKDVAHSYVLCRKPTDEVEKLTTLLSGLVDGSRAKLFFEPSEPSFELTINNVGGGWRVELFVDAGNVETGIYRWDSLGVRFFTTTANIKAFLDELESEFKS